MKILALTADASLQVAISSLAPDWDLSAARSAADATGDVDVAIIDLGSAERGVGAVGDLRARGIGVPCVVVGEGTAEGDATTWFVLRPFTFSDLRMSVLAAGASAGPVLEPVVEQEPVYVAPPPKRVSRRRGKAAAAEAEAARLVEEIEAAQAAQAAVEIQPPVVVERVAEIAPPLVVEPVAESAPPIAEPVAEIELEVTPEPVVPEAVVPEPVVPEPVVPEPVVPEPIVPEPVVELVVPEPVVPEPVVPEPVAPEPVVEPVVPEPVAPEPVVEPVVPEAVAPAPVAPAPVAPAPVAPLRPPAAPTPAPVPALVESPRASTNIVPARPVVVPAPVHRLLRLPRKRQAQRQIPRDRVPTQGEPAGEMARRVQAALSAGGDLASVVEMLPGLNDLRATAEALLAEIVETIRPETASIYRRNGDEFTILAGYGLSAAEMRSVVPAGQSLFREVTTGNGVLIDPVDLARGLVAGIAGTGPRVLMAAPLATEGWGCHGVAVAGGQSFEDEMLRRMCTLAERAAPSFALAQLLEKIRQTIA